MAVESGIQVRDMTVYIEVAEVALPNGRLELAPEDRVKRLEVAGDVAGMLNREGPDGHQAEACGDEQAECDATGAGHLINSSWVCGSPRGLLTRCRARRPRG